MIAATDRKRTFNSFRRFELEHDVFSLEIGGVHIWEWIRTNVFQTILRKKRIVGQSHHSTEKTATKKLYRIAKNVAVKNPFKTRDRDVVFIGHPRRKKQEDGYWWDIYCDPVLSELDLEYVYLERPHLYEHRQPAKTENIRYTDLIDYGIGIPWKLGFLNPSYTNAEKNKITRTEEAIQSEFDVSIDIGEKIDAVLSTRHRKPSYKLLFERINPQVAIIVVKSANRVRIEACKELGIPVVELQHGGGHHENTKYVYPSEGSLRTYPDYLFVFGEFWKENVEYPLSEDKIYPVGYPYLEQEREKYEKTSTKPGQVLFVSQGSVGEQLSRVATELSNLSGSIRIVYKLHPGEYMGWEERYPWLAEADIEVIDGDEPPLYKLLSQSEVQVGVNSTVLFEGLIFDLETIILDLQGYTQMEHLIETGAATVVSSAEELETAIEDGVARPDLDVDYFFEEDSIKKFSTAIENVIENEL